MLTDKKILTLKKGKTVFCLFLILLCFFAFTVYAKSGQNITYRICAPYVNINSENLVFYKYKVFGTEYSYKKYFTAYIEQEKSFLKSKDEFMVVKIKGERFVECKTDYILISEESIPELNAEFYIAKNIDFGNNSLPLKTVVGLLQKVIETIVIILFFIVFLVFF